MKRSVGQRRLVFVLVAAVAALVLLALVVGGGADDVESLDAAASPEANGNDRGELPAPSQVIEAPTAQRLDVAAAVAPAAKAKENHVELGPTPTLFFSDGSLGANVQYRVRDRVLSTRRENVSVSGTTNVAGRFTEWPDTKRELVLLLEGTQVGMQSLGHPFRFELKDGRVEVGVRRVLTELVAPGGSEGRRAVVQLSTRGADGTLRYAQTSQRLGEPSAPIYAEGDDPVRLHVFASRTNPSELDLQAEAVVPVGAGTQQPVAILLRPTPRGILRVTVPAGGVALGLTYKLAGVAPPWAEGWDARAMDEAYEVPSGRYSLRIDPVQFRGSRSELVPAQLRQTIEVWPERTTEVVIELTRAASLSVSAAAGRHRVAGGRPRREGADPVPFDLEDGSPFLISLSRNGKPVETLWRTAAGDPAASLTAGGATFSSSSLSPGVYDVQFQVRGTGRVGKPVRVELSPGERAHVEMP